MFRRVLIVGAVAVAADNTQCALDGAKSMDAVASAGLNIWAATKRCETGPDSQAKCAIDIASAIQSVNDMTTTIVAAVEDCGAIHTSHYACGMAVGGLTSASAALAAATGGVITGCPNALKQSSKGSGLGQATNIGQCVLDAKGSMTSLFSSASTLATVKKNCGSDGQACNENAINVVAGLADLGNFMASAVNDCSLFKGFGQEDAACAAHALGLVSSLHHLANAGIEIAAKCKVTEKERLYLENGEDAPKGSSIPLAFAAFLPISAVFGFVAGSRFAKVRAQRVREADGEMLMQEE